MKKNFLVLLMAIIVLFPFLAIAHKTYITGVELKTGSEQAFVNVTIEKGSATGKVSGDISGEVSIDNHFSLRINSGGYAGYEFGFNNWKIGDTYTGISTWFYDPESDETYIAIGGDIAAIGYSSEDGEKFVIARIGDTQRYGNFIYEETDNSFTSYNKDILLDVETGFFFGDGTGYYNGGFSAYLISLGFKDPDTNEYLLEAYFFGYTSGWGNGEGFTVGWSQETEYWWLGRISPPLYGVIGNIVEDGLIEHAVPLPSTLYLLGSGLFGILVIRKKKRKHS
ncbi:MAG: PEP-CTERM sorting domain-containing protein [Candidatus Desulfofervidus auxilii]|nr:PEP-CTERM sorting domain-containing protein [Candidatus Desulfofervidus auxilii]